MRYMRPVCVHMFHLENETKNGEHNSIAVTLTHTQMQGKESRKEREEAK